MTNKELALGLFRQGESRFKTMKEAFQDEDYPYTVRAAQECVELSLESVLISAGIDPPKWHLSPEVSGGNGKRAWMEMRSCACPRTGYIQSMTLKWPKDGLKKFAPSVPNTLSRISPDLLLAPKAMVPFFSEFSARSPKMMPVPGGLLFRKPISIGEMILKFEPEISPCC